MSGVLLCFDRSIRWLDDGGRKSKRRALSSSRFHRKTTDRASRQCTAPSPQLRDAGSRAIITQHGLHSTLCELRTCCAADQSYTRRANGAVGANTALPTISSSVECIFMPCRWCAKRWSCCLIHAVRCRGAGLLAARQCYVARHGPGLENCGSEGRMQLTGT